MSSRVATARRSRLRVLEPVAQLDEREHLAGDVAVLAPAAHLVVVELGVLVPERGRLGVLVHRLLPPHRGDAAEPAAAVDDRDGAPDLARQLARRVARARRPIGLALVAPALRAAPAPRSSAGVRLGQHAHAEQHDEQRRHQRAERQPRHRGCRRGSGTCSDPDSCASCGELATAGDRDERGARRERAARHLERLLGVARVRQRERERARRRRTRACGSASAR